MNKQIEEFRQLLEAGAGVHQLGEPIQPSKQIFFQVQLRLAKRKIERQEVILDEEQLMRRLEELSTGSSEQQKHEFLANIGLLVHTNSVQALRFIERLLPELNEAMRPFALMAQMAMRITLTQALTDTPQIIFSSALGGRDQLVRLDGFVLQHALEPWLPYQRELLSRLLHEQCADVHGEVERELWGEAYYIFRALLPYTEDIQELLQGIIDEARTFGTETHSDALVTNSFELDPERIQERVLELRSGNARPFNDWIKAIREIYDPDIALIASALELMR